MGLYGANTTIPFRAGSCRAAGYDKYIVIHTCHQMYKSYKDGKNHQANVSILVDTDEMRIADARTGVMNSNYGYSSHSFNQFVKVDDGLIVTVDHGDAYPRSVMLAVYPYGVSSGVNSDWGQRCETTEVLEIKGETGDNWTGVSVGGFECSEDAYLVAGNSVDQEDEEAYTTRNVFVGAVDKNTGSVKLNWITNFNENENVAGAGTPQLVKIDENRFLLMWNEYDGESEYDSKAAKRLALLNGKGQCISDIYEFDAELSDCQPIVEGDTLTWYACNNKTINFYQLSISPEIKLTKYSRRYGGLKDQPMKVTASTKTLSFSKLRKKSLTAAPITVTNAKGKVTYEMTGETAKALKVLKINKTNGRITVKKGTKKGLYKAKVSVTAAGTSSYKSGTKTVTVNIRVR